MADFNQSPSVVSMHLTQTQRENLYIGDENSFYYVDFESITYDVDIVDAVKIDTASFKSNPKDMRKALISSSNEKANKYRVLNLETTHFSRGNGFSYDDSIDDYKFAHLHNLDKIVEVYSIRKNSWTNIQDGLGDFWHGIHRLIRFPLNGAIQWETYYHKPSRVGAIVAFELVE
ncbi:hypothetical protein Ddye_014146 [Dipteronia dyeriana]|uniref:Uncharacterized protein n=1 Tax=Dipteronia dyeriana TaxID=168575 RepID=A0AAD9X7N6_9ROSI|nr:hypothetical protein Ddye_014146 [Dipteronia dyeriana]